MEQLTENKWFRLLVWLMLGLISLYFVWLRPLFLDVYRFLKAVLAPFLVAMIISYVLNPVVCMLSDRKVPRSMAVLLIYAVFLVACRHSDEHDSDADSTAGGAQRALA